jgi:hypothetical protein
MPLHVFRRVLPLVERVPCVRLAGAGDPLTHPDVLEMLRFCRGRNPVVRTMLVTAASGLDRRRAVALVALPLDVLTVWLDGARFDDPPCVAGLKTLAEVKAERQSTEPAIELCVVPSGRKKPAMQDALALAAELGAERVAIGDAATLFGIREDEALFSAAGAFEMPRAQ